MQVPVVGMVGSPCCCILVDIGLEQVPLVYCSAAIYLYFALAGLYFVGQWCHLATFRHLSDNKVFWSASLAFSSALFWWYFKWLNRFVQNWYYIGIDDFFMGFAYVLHATIWFSTVLPAVAGTTEFLETVFRFPCSFKVGKKRSKRNTSLIFFL